MPNSRSHHNIVVALIRLRQELPTLVGQEEWSSIQDIFQRKLDAFKNSTDPKEQIIISTDLIDLIAQYPSARSRINTEIQVQALLQEEIGNDLNAISKSIDMDIESTNSMAMAAYYALDWVIDSNSLPSMEDVIERKVTINPGGIEGGKSIKFSNMHLDLWEFSEITAGATLAGFDIVAKPHILVIAASVLLTIRALTKAMTVILTEQEASVFWGFIQARDENNAATELKTMQITNQERKKFRLEPLTKTQFVNSMAKLERLKCIRLTSTHETWEIIEHYEVTT